MNYRALPRHAVNHIHLAWIENCSARDVLEVKLVTPKLPAKSDWKQQVLRMAVSRACLDRRGWFRYCLRREDAELLEIAKQMLEFNIGQQCPDFDPTGLRTFL